MTSNVSFPLATTIDSAQADPAVQERWLAWAAAALSPETLRQLEAQAMAEIDRRYADDPGSLFNWRYREGQLRKTRLRKLFDAAHDRLNSTLVDFVEQSRAVALDHHLTATSDAQYGQRRTLALERQRDELSNAIETNRVYDEPLQADLARAEQHHHHAQAEAAADFARQRTIDRQQHDQALASRRLDDKLEKARLRLVAKLTQAQQRLDRPQQLHLKLYDVLQALTQFQMTITDRASRNPALADRLQMMSIGLTTVMASVQGLIVELNQTGPHRPTDEQLRQQGAQILAMAMEHMQQWQQQTAQEPRP